MTMIDNIETLLLNLGFVLILFSVYHKFIEGKISAKSEKLFIAIISSVSIIFCMTFTISPVPNFIFDMRQVPFIIGALYGGRRVAIFLLVVLLSYRAMIGMDSGFFATMLVYAFLFVILFFIIPYFAKTHRIKIKLFLTSLVWLSGVIILFTVVFPYIGHRSLPILGILYTIQIVAIVLFVKYIEKTKEEQVILKEVQNFEKLKIVSEIAASVSHEVRNPLTVTKGFLQLLKEPDIPDDKKEMYIRLSLDELHRAEEIITDYLTFAKPSLKNTEKLEVNKEIQYVVGVVEPYATMNNLMISLFETTNEIFVLGEKQLFHQCLINIAKNGIEAMENGGELIVKIIEEESRVIITIQDTGIGMSKEQIQQLGTPYFSTKEKGTGLGTMVVFSIIQSMQGKVQVDSVEGKGTIFSITLPKIVMIQDD